MQLTVEQALQRGVSAHKEGNLEEAERFYRAILQSQPKHPDANHNLGLIVTSTDQSAVALTLFKTALESNPKEEQFWFSYIDALFRLNRVDEAERQIGKYKKMGHDGDQIAALLARQRQRKSGQGVVTAVGDFYKNLKEKVLSEAAPGWLYADGFDRYFLDCNLYDVSPKRETVYHKETNVARINREDANGSNVKHIIRELNNEISISKKYNNLRSLIYNNDFNLISDSFAEDPVDDLTMAQAKAFNDEKLNVVVIGGGVCGLYLANSIKHMLDASLNVLILDNRSKSLNIREPFTRGWLTHIPASYFEFTVPENIKSLITCFGVNGLIGIPINILEAILTLSCKDQGIKFYFSEYFDYSQLDSRHIDLVFDATGGRLAECSYSAPSPSEMRVNVQKGRMDLKYAGVNQLFNLPNINQDHIEISLKPSGDFHYPYIRDTQICTHMVKLTELPLNSIRSVLRVIEEFNSSNLFYVWSGTLKEEINEGLILINLVGKEYKYLKSITPVPKKLKSFLEASPDIGNYLNENIIEILGILARSDSDNKIKIESPFKYLPYVNLNPSRGLLNGNRVFPVGDALFRGHPKVGNGLGSHLRIINELAQKMVIRGKMTDN